MLMHRLLLGLYQDSAHQNPPLQGGDFDELQLRQLRLPKQRDPERQPGARTWHQVQGESGLEK